MISDATDSSATVAELASREEGSSVVQSLKRPGCRDWPTNCARDRSKGFQPATWGGARGGMQNRISAAINVRGGRTSKGATSLMPGTTVAIAVCPVEQRVQKWAPLFCTGKSGQKWSCAARKINPNWIALSSRLSATRGLAVAVASRGWYIILGTMVPRAGTFDSSGLRTKACLYGL